MSDRSAAAPLAETSFDLMSCQKADDSHGGNGIPRLIFLYGIHSNRARLHVHVR
jgi:hypothetical protein